jgi:hypothetical protein
MDGAEANAADGGFAFQFGGKNEERDEEDEEVTAAYTDIAEEEGVIVAIVCGMNEAPLACSTEAPTLACRAPSLSTYISDGLSNVGGSAVSSSASRGGRVTEMWDQHQGRVRCPLC